MLCCILVVITHNILQYSIYIFFQEITARVDRTPKQHDWPDVTMATFTVALLSGLVTNIDRNEPNDLQGIFLVSILIKFMQFFYVFSSFLPHHLLHAFPPHPLSLQSTRLLKEVAAAMTFLCDAMPAISQAFNPFLQPFVKCHML